MAEKQIHSLSVDFSKVEPIKTDIKLKQFEFGSDVFYVSVYDEGKLYDPTGGKVLVCIRIQRPDGKMDEKIIYDTRLSDNHIVDNFVCSKDDQGNITASYFIINPYPFFTFCSGDIKCELWLRVYDDEGNTTINRVSQPFIYQIYKSISSYNMIDKESIDIITALIDAVTALQSTVTYQEYIDKLTAAENEIINLNNSISDVRNEIPPVDEEYSPESQNPQSGLAVANAIVYALSDIRDGAPSDLNTLKKLAAAIRNNPNFADVVIADINALRTNTSGASATIDAHLADINNPHNVTAGDVNLGLVDNTSDENKPLSKAAREALDLKVDKSAVSHTILNSQASKWKELIPSLYLLSQYVEFGRFVQSIDKVDITNGYETFPSVDVLIDYVASQLYPPPVSELNGTLYSNTEYQLGVVNDLTLSFPANPNPGDVVYINFMSPTTPTNLTIDMTNVFDIEIIPEPDTGYEIFGKYTPDGWIINYSEFSLDKWYYEEPVGI